MRVHLLMTNRYGLYYRVAGVSKPSGQFRSPACTHPHLMGEPHPWLPTIKARITQYNKEQTIHQQVCLSETEMILIATRYHDPGTWPGPLGCQMPADVEGAFAMVGESVSSTGAFGSLPSHAGIVPGIYDNCRT